MENQTLQSAEILQKRIAEIYEHFRPAPDEEDKPNSWTPMIQLAFQRTVQSISRLEILAHFNPQIWELVGDYGRRFGLNGNYRFLNPQPIPPRWLFAQELASAILERARLMATISEGLQRGSGSKIVGAFIMQFSDDICAERPKIKIPKGWPIPPDPNPRWNAFELVRVAEIFNQESLQSNLEGIYQNAASKILDTASGRIK